jgi:hypothetical protein
MDTLRQHPFFHPFFRRPLCRSCMNKDDYLLITAQTARKTHFLNDTDLLSLTTISEHNKHHSNAHPIRLYSRVEVMAASEAKLMRLGLTLEERQQQQVARSQRARANYMLGKTLRRRMLLDALNRLDLPRHGRCHIAMAFIKNSTRRSQSGHRRWKLDEVVQHFQFHPCNHTLDFM